MAATPDVEWVEITDDSVSLDEVTRWAIRPNCGAVVSFGGTVRNSSSTGEEIIALEYETSDTFARTRIHEVIAAARRKWPAIEAVAVHHRIGRVNLGELAVVVAVSAPHRGDAFSAAEFCIDTVKASVPMWKRECWDGGSVWSQEATPLANVEES